MRKQLSVLLLCVVLGLTVSGLVACGLASKSSSPAVVAAAREHDGDADNDSLGPGRYDIDHDAATRFGATAGPVDRRTIIALIKRFYTAAVAGDGVSGCSMLYWLAAEAAVEEHGQGGETSSSRSVRCARIASKLFRQRHDQLVKDLAAFHVSTVQVRAKHGWAVLDFGPVREQLVLVQREGGLWKMDELLRDRTL